ncbi:NADH-quinone oxidoreductase subunit B family protein [Geomonas propionica]|nr:NADH:ubiquinone oxidoreductase [Geomonas propionica]
MKVAITGLTACSGCQLTLLNCEDELPELLGLCELVYFPLAESGNVLDAQFDAAIVEGAVSTPKDLELLFSLRNAARVLVAYGTCALFGGVAAMNNTISCRRDLLQTVFGDAVQLPESFAPAPLANYVSVDAAVTGCPPEKQEIMELVAALAAGTLPPARCYPVCTECRSRENLCLLLEKRELCLGPVVQGGCNARCPATGIVCEGCRGPVREANVAQELELLLERGFGREEVERRMSRFKPGWNYGQRR